MKTLQQQIIEKKQEITHLEEELKHLESLSPPQRLAVQLHDMLCTYNHTDGCGWHYEMKNNKHNWDGYAHKTYLTKADRLFSETALSVESLIDIVKIIIE